jgi:hypothetical protein
VWGRLWRTLAVATFEIKAPEHNLPASQSDVHLMQHWQSTDQRLAPFMNLPHTEDAVLKY